jgi:polygalacturonase
MKLFTAIFLCLGVPLGAATFNVRELGATGDGESLDTAAVQKAFDALKKSGGTVVFPAGNYVCGPLVLKGSHITVQLEAGATLSATTNQAQFLKTGSGDWLAAKSSGDFNPFLSIKDGEDVTLTGKGVIEGNGHVWWEEAEKARQKVSGYTLPRPNLIVPTRITNLRVSGITIQNSPKFALVPTECEDVWIEGVKITAPERAANTDAIDPSISRNVVVTNCFIDVGDDNIAIKSGKKVEGREFACENITIVDCVFKHGHGMSIGSETVGGVRNVLVRNVSFENNENGIRIKSDTKRGGTVENLVCENITMKNVNPAITLTTVYQGTSAGDKKPGEAVVTPVSGGNIPAYRNIRISNLTATCPNSAGLILGLTESCISNVVLENVSITAAKPFTISNARGIQLKNVTVTVPKGEAFKLENAEVSGLPAK